MYAKAKIGQNKQNSKEWKNLYTNENQAKLNSVLFRDALTSGKFGRKIKGDLYKTQKGKVEAFPGPLGNQVYLFLKLGNGYMGI